VFVIFSGIFRYYFLYSLIFIICFSRLIFPISLFQKQFSLFLFLKNNSHCSCFSRANFTLRISSRASSTVNTSGFTGIPLALSSFIIEAIGGSGTQSFRR